MNDTWNGDESFESSKLKSINDNRTSEKIVFVTTDQYGAGNYDTLYPTDPQVSHAWSCETLNSNER